ncbi:hypothetical protein MCU_01409, partial [Bartonella elizabethae Re6043vi]
MKPQASQEISPRSSPTQEDPSDNESLESLLARLEKNALEEEENVAPSSEELKAIIAGLENDLVTGRWIDSGYAITDLKLMPALVDQANRKYPEMNLQFVLSPEEFTQALKKTIESDTKSSRFILNTGKNIHFSVIDHQTIDDQLSLVMFEPTTFDTIGGLLGLRLSQALQDTQLPRCHFAMAEMDIQRSSSECGIYCLSLAKKLHLESQKLERLHKDNVKGVLCEPDTPVSAEKLDSYLPVSLYKHAQGRRRLE